MKPSSESNFNHNYQTHLKHLKLKGLRPKTIDGRGVGGKDAGVKPTGRTSWRPLE
jgi:hypothetical protein